MNGLTLTKIIVMTAVCVAITACSNDTKFSGSNLARKGERIGDSQLQQLMSASDGIVDDPYPFLQIDVAQLEGSYTFESEDGGFNLSFNRAGAVGGSEGGTIEPVSSGHWISSGDGEVKIEEMQSQMMVEPVTVFSSDSDYQVTLNADCSATTTAREVIHSQTDDQVSGSLAQSAFEIHPHYFTSIQGGEASMAQDFALMPVDPTDIEVIQEESNCEKTRAIASQLAEVQYYVVTRDTLSLQLSNGNVFGLRRVKAKAPIALVDGTISIDPIQGEALVLEPKIVESLETDLESQQSAQPARQSGERLKKSSSKDKMVQSRKNNN